jgi:UDP-N-acetylglucosamine 2-epimerase
VTLRAETEWPERTQLGQNLLAQPKAEVIADSLPKNRERIHDDNLNSHGTVAHLAVEAILAAT